MLASWFDRVLVLCFVFVVLLSCCIAGLLCVRLFECLVVCLSCLFACLRDVLDLIVLLFCFVCVALLFVCLFVGLLTSLFV